MCGESEPYLTYRSGIIMDAGVLDCGYSQKGPNVAEHEQDHIHLKCVRCDYAGNNWYMETIKA